MAQTGTPEAAQGFTVIIVEHGTNLVNVITLDKEDITAFWQHIKQLLIVGLEKSRWNERYPIQSLYTDLLTGELKCWIVSGDNIIKGVAVTQDIEYPLGKSLLVYLLSGENMHEWADHLHKEFIKYAEKNNYKWIDACARQGLGKKYLAGLGLNTLNNHYCFEVK